MKARIGFKEKSADGYIGLTLDNIIELKPMDVGVAFMREYEEGFHTSYRIEAMIPYSNIAYIFCDPEEEEEES